MSVQTLDESDERTRVNPTADQVADYSENQSQKYQYYLILFLLIFAVLFRAGNRPLPLMVLEIGAIGLLLLCFLTPTTKNFLSKGMKILLWTLFLFPLLYLIPVPWDVWMSLPGHTLYADTLKLLDENTNFRAISIYPLKTQLAWLALLPPIAIFIGTLRLSVSQIQALVYVLIGIAVFQAVLGLIQYGDGVTSSFRFNNPFAGNGAEGTYANRNHLAGLLEMVLPIGLGLLALSVGRTRTELHYHRSWRTRLASLSGWHMNKTVIYAFVCILILLGLVFTQSKSGVALAMLGVFLSAIAYARRLGGTNVFGVIGSFFAVVVAIAIEIGLAPLLQRFSVDHLEDLRFIIFSNTIKGIGTFFPVGSGPGTYPFIYPRFQSIEETAFINHAHNDYLEWLMEGGLVAGLIILVCFWFYFRQWPKVWIKGYWSTLQFMKVGAGIGILLMMLHGLTDFNLHIPANAIYFAFLAAVFFYPQIDNEYSNTGNNDSGVRQRVKQKTTVADYRTEDQMTNNLDGSFDSSLTSGLTSSSAPSLEREEENQAAKTADKPEDICNPFAEKDK